MSDEFTAAMLQLCKDASVVIHYPTILHNMIHEHGGVEAALLVNRCMTPTFKKLWEIRWLEFSVEALMLKPEWRSLFHDEELAVARQRLEDCGYTPGD